MAMLVPVSLMRTMAASVCSGAVRVLVRTSKSYCSQIHRLEQISGAARRVEREFWMFAGFRRPEARVTGGVVWGRFVGELAIGQLGHDLAVMADAEFTVAGHHADLSRFEAPLVEDAEDFVFATLIGHEQHALLALAEHDLVRRHAGLALGHAV